VGGSVPLKAQTMEGVSRAVISHDPMWPEDQSNLNPRLGPRGEALRDREGLSAWSVQGASADVV
ncbi:hypothetical protein, partial [uncultured Bradyrhizobium sp.]|uniref:hypothetical protein n=1 Tax=uncultured Bradyrhizobium sp. TaxID=199684 RepID=UPI0027D9CC2C